MAGAVIVGPIHIRASKKQQLELQAALNNRKILLKLPAKVTHSGSFLVEKPLLEGVCKNRDLIGFDLGTSLQFSSGKYGGQIPVRDLPEKLELLSFSHQYPQFPKALVEQFQTAIKKCSLQSIFSTDKLSMFVQYKKPHLYVGVADKFHAAYTAIPTESKLKNYTEPFLLPLEYANLITQFKDLILVNEKNYIVLADSDTILELPALQLQENTLQSLLDIVTTHSIEIEAATLKIILSNNSLAKPDLQFTLETKNQYIMVNFKSDHAYISDLLPTSAKLHVTDVLQLDVKNLEDVVRKLSDGKVILSYNQHVIKLQDGTSTYLSQLLQRSNK